MDMKVSADDFAIAGTFTIARGSKTVARVIRVELVEGQFMGQGEGVPYARYGETVEQALASLIRVITLICPKLLPMRWIARCGICAPNKLASPHGNWPTWKNPNPSSPLIR